MVEKLIVTVTVDSTVSHRSNPYMPAPDDVAAIARQYVDAVHAGASICHHHGVRRPVEPEPGRAPFRIDIDGWKRLTDGVRLAADEVVVQFGLSGMDLEDQLRLMELGPDMMSVAFTAHDLWAPGGPGLEPLDIVRPHPRDELVRACSAAVEHGVQVEVECFGPGAYWNVEFVRQRGLLPDPVWATLLLGWPGGGWIAPTPDALLFMVNHLPAGALWNLSVMDPAAHWGLLAQAIAMGGHVRVGWEDSPYLPSGELARHNAELVEAVVAMAAAVGRDVASPSDARRILAGLPASEKE